RELGFEETRISTVLSVFKNRQLGFYLQDAYVQDWVNNTMLFLEVDDVYAYYDFVASLQLPQKYTGVRLEPIQELDWGKEFFLHDPSGILWHIGQFNNQ